MLKRLALVISAASVSIFGGLTLFSRLTTAEPLAAASFEALYTNPAPAPSGALNVLHLGHSLVGHDMPDMLAQLAQEGHRYNSQLGWGTFLKEHWDESTPRNGFETSNTHPQFRDGHEALGSGDYDAVVLTEAVEIRDAIKYMDSPRMLHNLADKARTHRPDVSVYLYETWHPLNDPEGWLERIDRDLGRYWEDAVLRPALTYDDPVRPIYVIPGGQVMARFVRAVEARGGIGPITTRDDLFLDDIHFNDYGAYLMALTHYAVLYQTSPTGLPHALQKADGTPADDPGPEAAQLMQDIVWEVVATYPRTGVRPD